MTGGRGCARLVQGPLPPPGPGARRPRHRVPSVVLVLSHDASAEQQSAPVSLYHRKLPPPRSSLFRHNKPRVVKTMQPAIDQH